MSHPDISEWRPMATAPTNGSRILVTIHASEQGPAEVDVVRWGTAAHAVEPAWIATDSDSEAPVIYSDGELASWMPLPDALSNVRRQHIAKSQLPPPDRGEIDGSSI
ncbi:MAG: hypothetical protein GY798_18500 [Hyphomicrobiales bacterium]|nr:hypothetical protein [Hyphomicrobiales bacterium]